jgi:hypothetical protein
MKEIPQEYVQRILGYVGEEDPLSIQGPDPKQLERLIKGASASRLRKRPAPGN